MKILNLQLRNVRQHADTSVSFSNGLTGILGVNGEGKSTLIEGIVWALFGLKGTRGGKKDLRWDRAPKTRVASVVLRFEVGGTVYEIDRNENTASLTAVGALRPIAEGTSVVDVFIPELLGMGLDEFQATFMCGQKDLGRLASMKGEPRRTFFLNVMGIGRIIDGQKALREDRSNKKRERDGVLVGLGEREPLASEFSEAQTSVGTLDGELVALRSSAVHAESSAELASAKFAASEIEKENHDELVRLREQNTGALNRADQEIARLSERFDAVRISLAKVDAATEDLGQLRALRSDREILRAVAVTSQLRAELTKRVDDIQEYLHQLEVARQKAQDQVSAYSAEDHESAECSIAALEAELDDLTNAREKEITGLQAQRSAKVDELRKAIRRRDAIKEAGEMGACPTCTRQLGEQFVSVIEGLQAEVDELTDVIASSETREAELSVGTTREAELIAEIRDRQTLVGEFKRKQADAKQALAINEHNERAIAAARVELSGVQSRLAEVPSANGDAGNLAEVESAIARLEELERSLTEDRVLISRVPELQAELERWQMVAQAADDEISSAAAAIEASPFDADLHAKLKSASVAAQEKLQAARTDLARCDEMLKAARARYTRAESALAEYDRRASHLRALEAELAAYEETDQALSAFRHAQASGIRPEMEELTSAMVAQLTDGRYESASLTEDFEVILQRDGVDKPVISGGEEDVVSIAQRIAVSQMITARAGQPLSLLILDEPFGSLDGVRRDNILALIRRLRSVFEQVIVISHVEEVKDAVDHTITVTFDAEQGRSVVTQSAAA